MHWIKQKGWGIQYQGTANKRAWYDSAAKYLIDRITYSFFPANTSLCTTTRGHSLRVHDTACLLKLSSLKLIMPYVPWWRKGNNGHSRHTIGTNTPMDTSTRDHEFPPQNGKVFPPKSSTHAHPWQKGPNTLTILAVASCEARTTSPFQGSHCSVGDLVCGPDEGPVTNTRDTSGR